MDLIVTPENPPPPGAVVSTIRAVDGMSLRVARWHPQGRSTGTIVVCCRQGGIHREILRDGGRPARPGADHHRVRLARTGGSDRDLDNSRKGHVDDFDDYGRDLDVIMRRSCSPFCPPPFFALAHSMGAAVLLAHARGARSLCTRRADLADDRDCRPRPSPRRAAAGGSLDVLGFGGSFIPGGGETAIPTRPFAANALTRDPVRYARAEPSSRRRRSLGLGDPTDRLGARCLQGHGEFEDPNYPLDLVTPMLVICRPWIG